MAQAKFDRILRDAIERARKGGAALMHTYQFTVEGRAGNFPLDMLRYDACHPATQEDVAKMQDFRAHELTMGTTHQVTLKFYAARILKGRQLETQITPERWESFGWTVVEQPRRIS